MSGKKTPARGQTPPKGRPTRARDGGGGRRRVFGATAQWILVIAALLLVFVVMVVMTDGGDFNPFNDDTIGVGVNGSVLPLLTNLTGIST